MKKETMLLLFVAVTVFVLSPLSVFAMGAIAFDDNGGKGQPDFFIVVGEDTSEKATEAVLKKCLASGKTGCRVLVNFERCGSVAASDKSFGAGWGITGRIARNMSLRNCGNGDCSVILNECEDY